MLDMTMDGVRELSRVEMDARLSALLVEDSDGAVDDVVIDYTLLPRI